MTGRTERVARGAAWIYAFRWLDRLLRFGLIAVLARLLSREDFGVVAIASGFVAVIEGLSEFDVKSALIHAKGTERNLHDTAWSMATGRGLVAALVLTAIALGQADAQVGEALLVLAAAPALDGLANPRFVLFERDLEYRKLALQTLSATAVTLTVTIWIAAVHASHWALVGGIVAGSACRSLASYVLRPYRPRFTFARARDILSFSGWMTLGNLVATLAMRTDRVIVGSFLGKAGAGTYLMTQQVGSLPTNELISPLQRILFPGFREIADDADRLRRAARESINILASLSLPAAIGFALTANDLVPIMLGDQWHGIVPLLVVLVPILGLRAALASSRSCALAVGRTRLLFQASTWNAIGHLPLFVAGTAWFGLEGAIWATVIAGTFYAALCLWLLRATVDLAYHESINQLSRPLMAAGVMFLALIVTDSLLLTELFETPGSWTGIGIKVAIGGTSHIATQYGLWRLAGRPAGFETRLRDLAKRR